MNNVLNSFLKCLLHLLDSLHFLNYRNKKSLLSLLFIASHDTKLTSFWVENEFIWQPYQQDLKYAK